MLEANKKEQSSVTRRIIYKGVSEEGGILNMDIRKKMLVDVKQSWRSAKTSEAENKQRKTPKEIRREERKKNGKKFRDIPAVKKVPLESTTKVAGTYDARLFKLKEKLLKSLFIMFLIHSLVLILRWSYMAVQYREHRVYRV